MIQREASDRAGEGTTLNNIGAVHNSLGNYLEAGNVYDQALDIHLELGDQVSAGTTRANIGTIYHEQGLYEEALESYRPALAILREVNDPASVATILANMGAAHEQQGEVQQALDFYQQSIAAHEQVRTDARLAEFKISLMTEVVDVYERASLLLVRLNQPAQAFDLTERARARAFLDQLGNTRLDIGQVTNPQLAEQERTLRQELSALAANLREQRAQSRARQDATTTQTLTTQIAAKQREYEDLLIQLQLSNPAYAALVTIAPLTLTQTQQLIPADTTLLSYFVTPDKTLAFLVTRNSFQVVELPVREQELYDAIREFGDAPQIGNEVPPGLRRLYDWLIAPLKMHLTTPVVGIIPHGSLHYLPFAALTDAQHYLVDDYTLFTLPSASTLSFLQPKPDTGEASLLAFAQGQAEGLPPLRYAEQEAGAIARLYNTQAIVGSTASETDLKARAGTYTILHLAAHGQLNADRPLFSRIVLAPGKEDDGGLEVHEVYSLDLKHTNLVVLSACQTELGALRRGDDIVGLNRAFLYAGAPTVVASLWSVDDQATSLLMTAFYTHLKQGEGKAGALRAAQREIRARAEYAHPYYWAAFVLTGDPGVAERLGPTAFLSAEAVWPWLLGGVAVLAVGGLVWWRRRRPAAARL